MLIGCVIIGFRNSTFSEILNFFRITYFLFHIYVFFPLDRSTLVSDSGKLTVLDQLLTRLKQNDHRVLIYSQMTKMIDIIEVSESFSLHFVKIGENESKNLNSIRINRL